MDFRQNIEHGYFQLRLTQKNGDIHFQVIVPGGMLNIQANEHGALQAAPNDFQCEPEFIDYIITSIESY